ncbi:Na+/H+ antiporter [Gloeobacter morelensis]|uniref:Na+/H+ antiporter n=1 Tax=Gloeobacter morelensis MG652769 TaxID=2781736 RepID=A0ABY3PT88_9CYAN|nr:Na+/H+ antiporter [Gloeobacter morelensis]UFP96734.1 Na+/H+ antiporter [Gloeobacter morelensis MG652769]
MHAVETVLGLLVAVCALFVLARRVSVPYSILLVLGGLGLSLVPGLPQVELEPELVFVLFLPPLLTAAAWNTNWRDFKANLQPIVLLAVGLVFATTFAVATAVRVVVPEMPWAVALVLGAIVSPPDAVAATSIAQLLGVPRRVVTILEGESLVNDASGLVAYRFAVAAVVTGHFSPVEAGAQFLLLATGGVAVGLAAGWLLAFLQRQVEETPVEIALTLLGSYGAYLLGEQLHLSGVLAAVTVGLYHRRLSSKIMSPVTRIQAIAVWNMVVFVLNGLAFILIGLQLPTIVEGLTEYTPATLAFYATVASAAAILVRLVWVFLFAYGPRWLSASLRRRDPIAWRPVLVVGWTGMRGVVSLAAALAVPTLTASGAPFPQRNLILFLSFSVILVTLVLQGLTLPPLIRLLGLGDDGQGEREERFARQQAAAAALACIDTLVRERPAECAATPLVAAMRQHYADRLRIYAEEVVAESSIHLTCKLAIEAELQHRLLAAERERVLQLRAEGLIDDEALLAIERDLDIEELRLARVRALVQRGLGAVGTPCRLPSIGRSAPSASMNPVASPEGREGHCNSEPTP